MPQLGIVQQIPPNVFNVRKYGAVGNGTHDDTAAIAAAIADATAAQGAVYFPGGTPGVSQTVYLTSQTITLASGVWLVGDGYQASILMLKNGSNVDLIQTANFATLTGSNLITSPYNFGVVGLTLDGNASNQSAGTSTSPGRCLSIYGYGYRLDNIRWRNAYADGVYSEWSTSSASPGNDSMEAQISHFKGHNCGNNGLIFLGPHDSQIHTGILFNNGTGTTDYNLTFPSTTNQAVGTRVRGVHCWGGTGNYPVVVHDSTIKFNACEFEGGVAGQFFGDNDVHIADSILFTGSANRITKGIVLGTNSSVQASHSTIIGCDVQDCLAGALDVSNAGKYSVIDLHVYEIHHPVNTTTSTAVSAPGTQDIVLAGGVSTVIMGMSLEIDRNGVNHEVVTVNSINTGASSVNCTFANTHTGTYTVANAIMIGTPDATNRVTLHASGVTGGLQDETFDRVAGSVLITPASIYQTPLKLNQVTGQTAPMLSILNGGTFIGGFGSTGSVAVGISPNTTIEGLFQAQDDAHKAIVGIAFSATHSGDLAQLQDYQFNTLTRFNAKGNLAIGAAGSNTTPLTVSARNTTDVVAIFQGITSQSGDLTNWKDGTGAVAANVNSTGNFGIGITAGAATELKIQARADGDHPLSILQHSGTQSANMLDLEASDGTLLSGFGPKANLGIGAAPVATQPLTLQARAATDIITVFKGTTSQSGDMTEWQDVNANVLTSIAAGGNLGIGTAPISTTELLLKARAAGDIIAIIKGTTSQTGDALEIQDVNANILTSIAAGGNLGIGITPIATTELFLKARATGDITAITKALTSQTGDFAQYQDVNGAVLTNIAVTGNVGIGVGAGGTTQLKLGARADNNRPLAIQAHSGTQSANQTEWLASDGSTLYTAIGPTGNLGVGVAPITTTELYAQARAVGDVIAILKGAASQSGDFTQWQKSDGTVLSNVNSVGNLGIGASALAGTELIAQARATTDIVAILKAIASQSADIFDIQNSSGTVLAGFGSGGNLGIGVAASSTTQLSAQARAVGDVPIIAQGIASQTGNLLNLENSSGTVLSAFAAGGNLGVGASPVSTTEGLFQARAVGDVVLVTKGIASQSGDLFEAQNSSGTVLTAIGSGGNVGIGVTPGGSTNLKIQARNDTDHTLSILGHSSTQSANLLDLQNSGGTLLGGFDSKGRLVGSSTNPPTAAAGANAGSTPPSPVIGTNSNDMRGTITFGTGGSPAAGAQCVISFANAFANTPFVTASFNDATAALLPSITNVGTGAFTVTFHNAPAANQTNTVYSVTYHAMG